MSKVFVWFRKLQVSIIQHTNVKVLRIELRNDKFAFFEKFKLKDYSTSVDLKTFQLLTASAD